MQVKELKHAEPDVHWLRHGNCKLLLPRRITQENTPMSAAMPTLPQNEQVPAELASLTAAVLQLPAAQRAQIEPLLAGVIEGTRRRRRILTLVQEALSQLRLDMKYLMFDLEATRRERDEYHRQLKEGYGEE